MYAPASLLAAVLVWVCHAKALNLGSCPDVQPMENFDMNQMLGKWYLVQATDTARPCETLTFTKHPDGNPNKFQVTDVEQHSTMWKGGLHHEHRVTGDLVVTDTRYPGRMELDIILDVGATKFVVFMTDYDNFAGTFTCKKLPLVYQWKAAILSRKPTLDMVYVDKVRNRLSSYNIDPFNLNIISQKHCAQEGAQGSMIQLATNVAVGVRDKVSGGVRGIRDQIDDVADNIGGKISNVIRKASSSEENASAR